MARTRLITYRWPSHNRVTTVVLCWIGAVALVALAVKLTDDGPTCGGVLMQAADQCVSGDGSVSSYGDIAGSPLPSVLFAVAVGLLGWLVLHSRRYAKAGRPEITNFEHYVTERRAELRTGYDSSPQWQAKWPTPDELIARFDRKVWRIRKRKGYARKKKNKTRH